MVNFVEYLRAMRALRIVGIVLGVLLVLGLLLRLYFLNGPTPEKTFSAMENSPTAHVTRTQLPDGGTRTVIDDPKFHRHAVVVRHGSSFDVELREPRGTVHSYGNVVMGRRNANHTTRGDTELTTMSYVRGNDMEWGSLLLATIPVGLLVATMLAGPLAKENHGHLELAWTKPISRERYALAALAIDAGAIVVSQVLAIVVVLLSFLVWAVPSLSLGPEAGAKIGLALIGPFAWYACLTALSASLKRGPGAVIGAGWAVAIVAPALAAATHEATDPLVRAFHAILSAVMYADPIAYVWFQRSDDFGQLAGWSPSIVAAVAGLAVVYAVLAVVQWRRVEA